MAKCINKLFKASQTKKYNLKNITFYKPSKDKLS